MIGLVAAALATGLAMRFYPSFGKPLGTLMLIVTALTVVVQGAGH